MASAVTGVTLVDRKWSLSLSLFGVLVSGRWLSADDVWTLGRLLLASE